MEAKLAKQKELIQQSFWRVLKQYWQNGLFYHRLFDELFEYWMYS